LVIGFDLDPLASGYMIHRLLHTVMGRRAYDDRDHYGNKRLDLAGPLLGNLFRQLFARLAKVLLGCQRQFVYGRMLTRFVGLGVCCFL